MLILKFGGSSVADAARMRQTAAIIRQATERDRVLTVVSAQGGVTDALVEAGQKAAAGDSGFRDILEGIKMRHLQTVQELMPLSDQSRLLSHVMQRCHGMEDICQGIYLLGECSPATRDRLLAFGELLSSQILSDYLLANGIDNAWKDARELIRTDAQHNRAGVDFQTTAKNIRDYLSSVNEKLVVVPGFIAAGPEGQTTTLGRGGSDYTAAILGSSAAAAEVQIWTDVSGMMTADPRLVGHARPIPYITFDEAMELSHFGAKVIYPPTLQPVMVRNIPVRIKNTFAPAEEGTLIHADAPLNGSFIRGISCIAHISLLSLEGSGMVGIPGFSRRLFEALAIHRINVILITQASSEHSICVGIDSAQAQKAKQAVEEAFVTEIGSGQLQPVTLEDELAIVALVGDKMKSKPGSSGRMFGALGRNGINVRAIAQGSSERNISAVIAARDIKKAVNVLHEEFFETTYKQVNLFIAGTGNVGGRLLAQLERQLPLLREQLHLQLRVVGLANSRRMAVREQGIEVGEWKAALQEGVPMDLHAFVQAACEKNLRNTVFVDVTAHEGVAACYEDLMRRSISVVACNKIACSSDYARYQQLKETARQHQAAFLFETNVGAGLPLIGTLNDLLRSGDAVHRIEAVLSGTLNFVFNHYDGSRPFAEVVRQAQEEGYTEPDPRLDLTGTDVMRKIMILAREAGHHMEMEAIENDPFLPPSCLQGSVEDFYRELSLHEDHFRKLFQQAADRGAKLKYVARLQDGHAAVGLQAVPPGHDFFHLYGKDNIVLLYTERYPEQPLVIKGAGAGAEVTASGVFADIIRAARV